jgi:hypothetical protein
MDRTSVDSHERVVTKKIEENWYIQKIKNNNNHGK